MMESIFISRNKMNRRGELVEKALGRLPLMGSSEAPNGFNV